MLPVPLCDKPLSTYPLMSHTHTHLYYRRQTSGAHIRFLSVQFALQMLWWFQAENPSGPFTSTHESVPVKTPSEKNGPFPLIYRLSQEEGPLMHWELTSCAQRAVALLCSFDTIRQRLINHIQWAFQLRLFGFSRWFSLVRLNTRTSVMSPEQKVFLYQ